MRWREEVKRHHRARSPPLRCRDCWAPMRGRPDKAFFALERGEGVARTQLGTRWSWGPKWGLRGKGQREKRREVIPLKPLSSLPLRSLKKDEASLHGSIVDCNGCGERGKEGGREDREMVWGRPTKWRVECVILLR